VGPLVIASTFLHFWVRNLADPDLWGHLTWGRAMIHDWALTARDTYSYTAVGRPFFDHEWLADVITAWTFDAAGSGGLIALKLGLGGLMLVCILDAVRTMARDTDLEGPVHPLMLAAGMVLSLAAIAPGATFRPQLFTMAFTAATWALLVRADERLATPSARSRISWELWCLPFLLVFWANVHGGFLVGLALIGLFAASVVWRAWRGRAGAPGVREAAVVVFMTVLSAAAPLVNPYGVELYRYLLGTLHLHDGITEWDPVPLLGTAFIRFKLLLAATVAVSLLWWQSEREPGRRARLAWRLAFVAFAAVYAFRHQRHTVLFAIVAAPIVVVAGERLRRAVLARRPALAPRAAVMAAITIGVLVVPAVQLAGIAGDWRSHGTAIRYSRLAFPIDALNFIRQHDLRGNLALPVHWGSFTIHQLGDRVRVFIDGRFEAVYPRNVLDDHFAFIHGREGWERLLDDYPTDMVLVQRTHGSHERMFKRSDFAYVYSDRGALLFVRRNPTNSAALDRLTRMARRPPLPAEATVFP
jgi:hypothetical protein